jgi:hypothetical protein
VGAAFFFGAFMALGIIGYGAVQAVAPRLLARRTTREADTVAEARLWVGALNSFPPPSPPSPRSPGEPCRPSRARLRVLVA